MVSQKYPVNKTQTDYDITCTIMHVWKDWVNTDNWVAEAVLSGNPV